MSTTRSGWFYGLASTAGSHKADEHCAGFTRDETNNRLFAPYGEYRAFCMRNNLRGDGDRQMGCHPRDAAFRLRAKKDKICVSELGKLQNTLGRVSTFNEIIRSAIARGRRDEELEARRAQKMRYFSVAGQTLTIILLTCDPSPTPPTASSHSCTTVS